MTGSSTCPAGYSRIEDEAECRAASQKYGVPFTSTVKEPGLLGGCVVHGIGTQPSKTSYNTDADGTSAGGQQFVICNRDDVDPCVTIGDACGSTDNYKWNSKGYCQGTCKSPNDRCNKEDKCCQGVCTPRSMDCPMVQNLNMDAKDMGQQLMAIFSGLKQLQKVTS